MKKFIYIISFFLFISCGEKIEKESNSNPHEGVEQDINTNIKKDSNLNEPKPFDDTVSNDDDTIESTEFGFIARKESVKNLSDNLSQFITKGFEAYDTAYGDINLDGKVDLIMILKNKKENIDPELARPLLLLTKNNDESYSLAKRNDNVVLKIQEGGVFGDPYDGITIKNGYFSIEHYGGSSWRWTKIITFKYDKEKKDWFLHKDGGVSYHTSNPDEIEEDVKTKKDFGIIKFEEYNN